jgi:hypothetical protein
MPTPKDFLDRLKTPFRAKTMDQKKLKKSLQEYGMQQQKNY